MPRFNKGLNPVDPCIRFLASRLQVGQLGIDVPFDKRITFNKQLLRKFKITQEQREVYDFALSFNDKLGRAGLERIGKSRGTVYRELRIARNNAMNSTTSKQIHFNKKTSRWDSRRKRLHDRIVKEIIDAGDVATGKANVLFTGGYSGSGKGQMTKRLLKGRKAKYVHMDSDIIKERLAKADGLLKIKWEAPLYHEEATVILKRVQAEAMRLNKHILYDGTLNGTDKAIKYANDLIKRGYKLEVGYAKVSMTEALQRTVLRYFEKGGRLVDPALVVTQWNNPLKTLTALKKKAYRWSVYDTSGKRVLNPKLIERGGKGFTKPKQKTGYGRLEEVFTKESDAFKATEKVRRALPKSIKYPNAQVKKMQSGWQSGAYHFPDRFEHARRYIQTGERMSIGGASFASEKSVEMVKHAKRVQRFVRKNLTDKDGYVTLYRGIREQYSWDIRNEIIKKGGVNLKQRTLSSWTLDKNTAKKFAEGTISDGNGLVMKQRVHYSKIYDTPSYRVGSGYPYENEFVVMSDAPLRVTKRSIIWDYEGRLADAVDVLKKKEDEITIDIEPKAEDTNWLHDKYGREVWDYGTQQEFLNEDF